MHEQEFEKIKIACEQRGLSFTEMLALARILPDIHFCIVDLKNGKRKIRMFRARNKCMEYAEKHGGRVL